MSNETKSVRSLHPLTEAAMLVAAAFVLSLVKIPLFSTFGGSITICSLPILLLSYRRGIKWGLAGGLALALFQMVNFKSAGYSGGAIAIIVLFDYLLPFTLLGLGGIFKGKLGSVKKELGWGAVFGLALRLLCHIVSGYLVWGEYAEWFFGNLGDFGQSIMAGCSANGLAMLYSVVYNMLYLVPEMILTAVLAVLISRWANYGLKK